MSLRSMSDRGRRRDNIENSSPVSYGGRSGWGASSLLGLLVVVALVILLVSLLT